MISRLAGAALLACGLTLAPVLPTGAASAGGGATVNVVNMSFAAATVTVPVGGTVTWQFQDMMTHDATSTQGFWASGPRSSGSSYAFTFASAGSYSYLCTIHPSMRGVVRVPVSATGSPGAGWNLRWATTAGSGGTTYDVQIRKPGSKAWKALKTDTPRPTAKFNPSTAGKYAVRARTTDGPTSAWSPVRSLKIT